MFKKIKTFFAEVSAKAKAGVAALFAAMFFMVPAQAADWDTAALVKTITDGAAIVVAIGTAILGVIVLTFGFKMAKSMLRSG